MDLRKQLEDALIRERKLLKNQEKYQARLKELEEKIENLHTTVSQHENEKWVDRRS